MYRTYRITIPGQAPFLADEQQVAELRTIWQEWFSWIATELLFSSRADAWVYQEAEAEKGALHQQITVLLAYQYDAPHAWELHMEVQAEIQQLDQQIAVLSAFQQQCVVSPRLLTRIAQNGAYPSQFTPRATLPFAPDPCFLQPHL